MKRNHEKNPQLQSEKKKKIKILIMLLLGVFSIVAILLFIRICSGESILKAPEATPVYLNEEGGSTEGEAEEASRDEILEELAKQQLIVTDKLSSNITFSSGEIGTIGEWIVENPAENNIIQQAEVFLDDLLIAKSTPIYPNQHITAIELLENVETGEYDVIAYINYYDIETQKLISKAGYKIHLTVR